MTTRKASTKTKWCKSRTILKRFRVKSNSSRTYTVVALENLVRIAGLKSQYPAIEWQCSCPGWTMHTPRHDCKHIRHVKEHAA